MRALALLALLLAGCAASPERGPLSGVRFAPAIFPQGVAQNNLDLAEDFLSYTFELETGERLDGILRYETPIGVYFTAGLEPYRDDIDALLTRLRREAELDIAEIGSPDTALIVVEAVPRAEIERVFAAAACFIVPGETRWRDFVRRRLDDIPRWGELPTLGRAAIFLPADTTPQDVRDCLHEELTQALGPANDLYRVADSIWNDDNLHGVATPYNMLMLRVLYQPEIRSGMSRAEVAAVLPRLLDRLNPEGRDLPRRPRHGESRTWNSAIEVALLRGASHAERLGAARAAVDIAREMRPVDHRLAVSLLALGQLSVRRDPAAAASQFAAAFNLSRRLHPPDDIRVAHAAVHVAVMALAAGQPELALRLAREHRAGALKWQSAVLLAGFATVEADALAALGGEGEAQVARLDSLRWARYGLGDASGALAREQTELVAQMQLGGDLRR